MALGVLAGSLASWMLCGLASGFATASCQRHTDERRGNDVHASVAGPDRFCASTAPIEPS